MAEGEDRRRYPRLNVKRGACITVVASGGSRHKGTVRNVSVTGACIADFSSQPKVSAGDTVSVEIDGLSARNARVVRMIGGFILALDYGLDDEDEAVSKAELEALLGQSVTF